MSTRTTTDIDLKFDRLLVEKLGAREDELGPQVNFTDDLGADSLDMVDLTLEFEKEFNITIPDEDVSQLLTVGQAKAYLLNKLEPS